MNRKRTQRRQRRIISILTIVIALILIVGFAGYFLLNKEDATESGTSQQTEAPAASTESQTDDQNTQTEAGKNTYESLLDGTGKLSISYYKENVYADSDSKSSEDELIGYLKSEDYTLKEFVDELDAIFKDENKYPWGNGVTSVGYSYLDCGNDGTKELAIKIVCPVVDSDSDINLIFKEMDDKVQLEYAFAEWSRSVSNINEYGVITGGGSGGASLHITDTHKLDADGKFVYGYSQEEESDILAFNSLEEHDPIDTSSYEGNICVYSLRTKPTTQDDYKPEYYSYTVFDDSFNEMNIPNLYTDSVYKNVMDTFQEVDFLSMEDFNKKIDEKLASIGITKEMLDGKVLEYTTINVK